MKAQITLTDMAQEHLDEIMKIELSSYSTPWSRAMFEAELENPQAHYFVAEADGTAVGYAGLLNISGEGHLTNITVHPDFRQQGVARELMIAIISYALQAAVESITLEVRECARIAREFYEKMGFQKVGRRKGYYQKPDDDAILMTLLL